MAKTENEMTEKVEKKTKVSKDTIVSLAQKSYSKN